MVHRGRVFQRRWESRKPLFMNRRNNLDNSIQHFYNDVFRYSPEKVGVHCGLEAGECAECELLQDEWRKFVSQTCPGPRSAHAVVASPSGGGKLFLFGMLPFTHFWPCLIPSKFRG